MTRTSVRLYMKVDLTDVRMSNNYELFLALNDIVDLDKIFISF